jgi:hypothetical protein
MDFRDAEVVRWIDDHGLRRRRDEQVMQFGHRVFVFFVRSATYGVIAELFVPRSGWVPVDVAGTVAHQPADRDALFGNTDGQHLAFHVDPDLEPAQRFQHAWAQYPLLQWVGGGDFWGNHQQQSHWTVVRSAIPARAN